MWFWKTKSIGKEDIDNRTDKRKLGDIGENAVCEYLKNKGFSVLDRNYLRKWGELDLVMKKERKVHFIEVKSVSREINQDNVTYETEKTISRENIKNKLQNILPRYVEEYRAEDNLHPHKLDRLKRAIQTYMADRKISDQTEWQFDVATVLVDQAKKICKVAILEDIVL